MDDLQALSRLHDLAMLSSGTASPEAILAEVVDIAIAVSDADCGDIQLLDPASGDLRITVQRGFPSWWADAWNRASKGQGACRSAIETGTRVIVEDVRSDPLFVGRPTLRLQIEAGVRSMQSTPLLTLGGKVVGTFSTHFKQPHRPDDRVLRWLDLLARQAADLIDNAVVTSALRRSESRFRALAQSSWDVLYCMSPDWSQMCFLEGKGFIADTHESSADWLDRYIDSADQPRVRAAIDAAIRTKSAFDLEHRVRRADGSPGWTHSRAVPVFGADGTIAEWFGAAKDVTEAKRVAEELFDQRQRLEALLQSLPVGVAFTDSSDCAQVSGNTALLRMLEFGPADNISASASDPAAAGRRLVFLHEGRSVEGEALPLQRAAREGRATAPTEIEVRMPSGRGLVVEISAAPIRNAQDKVIGGVAVIADITDRKRAVEAQEQSRLKDEFLAILGHELRNPLAAISNAMDALEQGVSAARRESIDDLVRRQVGTLRRLVDDLLDVSRITHGQIRLQKEEISLAELLSAAAEAALPAVRAKAQNLGVGLQAENTRFLADKVRLHQILANLLDNASKYTGRGGRIELAGAREGDDVVLRCKDSGCGIAPQMQERIFEPLVRLESAAPAAAGLGLGLTLVRRLAALHGGQVSVRSDGAGTGSEFIVRIPFVAAVPARSAPETAAPGSVGAPSASIVIVDDNPDVADSLMLVLEQAGHRVRRFADGPSALAALAAIEESVPDAILLDIGLPVMSGHEVLARMRRLPSLRHTLFIGVSGLPEKTRTGTDGPRFDHYLVKPIDIEAVLRIVGEHVLRGWAPRTLLIEDHADLAAATAALLRREGLDVAVVSTGHEAIEVARRIEPRIILCDMSLPDMSGLDVIRELRRHFGAWGTHAAVVTGRSIDELRAYNDRAESMGVAEFVSKPLTAEWVRALVARLERR